MKVVFVAPYIPETNYTRDLGVYYNKILKKGDKIYLCGVKGEVVNDGRTPKVDYVWKRTPGYIFDILKYINKIHPDVIHLQHEFKMYGGFITAILFPLLILILKLQGYPVVVTIHGVVSKKQVDMNFLKSFNVKPNNLMKIFVTLFFSYIYISTIFLADKVTVHAPALKKVLEDYIFLANKKVIVIDHGVREIKDLRKNKDKIILNRFPILKNKKIILVFGLFSPRKGYENLVKSFAKFLTKIKSKDYVLALVGDVKEEFTAYKDKVMKVIEEEGIKNNVLISGYVNGVEIDEFYRNAKVVVIPAVISFNTSGPLSLSLAYKKPLLVSNVKPIAEEVSSNSFGLLYDLNGKKTLENQLAKLVSDRKLYNNVIQSLEISVPQRYWTNIARKHYQLYKQVCHIDKNVSNS
jgi:glycosyltransferase involved in cell wall biosynthesis